MIWSWTSFKTSVLQRQPVSWRWQSEGSSSKILSKQSHVSDLSVHKIFDISPTSKFYIPVFGAVLNPQVLWKRISLGQSNERLGSWSTREQCLRLSEDLSPLSTPDSKTMYHWYSHLHPFSSERGLGKQIYVVESPRKRTTSVSLALHVEVDLVLLSFWPLKRSPRSIGHPSLHAIRMEIL